MLSEELRQIVFRTIESLPEDLRMAITLRELDGLSYEEIAAIMACPGGCVAGGGQPFHGGDYEKRSEERRVGKEC